MAAEIITTEDLREFKRELLEALGKLLEKHCGEPAKKWLKSNEVRKLLGISPGSLQNLRVNGTLPYAKIGGVILYDYVDIQKMLAEHRCEHLAQVHTRQPATRSKRKR